jgi:hypothetical protein
VTRLCRAAGRRLDLLQLPRSGFGQLALVPLGYLLLLGLVFGPLLWAETLPREATPETLAGASLYPWNDKPRKLPMRGPLGHLQWLWWMAEPRIIVVFCWMVGVSYSVYLLVQAGMKLEPVPTFYNRYFNKLMKFWFGKWWH